VRFPRRSVVAPLLINLKASEVTGPLSQFDYTECTKEGLFDLMISINSKLKVEHRLTNELLKDELEHWWIKLWRDLRGIISKGDGSVNTETGFKWLYTSRDLAGDLSQINCPSMWLITDPLSDTVDAHFIAAVTELIQKGADCTIIYPDGGVREVETAFKMKKLGVKAGRRIARPEMAAVDYLIVNLDEDKLPRGPVFTLIREPDNARNYCIEVVEIAASRFVIRFRKFVQDGQEIRFDDSENEGLPRLAANPILHPHRDSRRHR
jgi:hypothetical protein